MTESTALVLAWEEPTTAERAFELINEGKPFELTFKGEAAALLARRFDSGKTYTPTDFATPLTIITVASLAGIGVSTLIPYVLSHSAIGATVGAASSFAAQNAFNANININAKLSEANINLLIKAAAGVIALTVIAMAILIPYGIKKGLNVSADATGAEYDPKTESIKFGTFKFTFWKNNVERNDEEAGG